MLKHLPTSKPTPFSEETEIFLFMSRDMPQARGFYDFGDQRAYTVAFTSADRANTFLAQARKRGLLRDVDLLFRMTVGEFFQWKETGRTDSELTVDPDPAMIEHHVFDSAVDLLNARN